MPKKNLPPANIELLASNKAANNFVFISLPPQTSLSSDFAEEECKRYAIAKLLSRKV
jgi:hypothetical protein